MCVLCVLSICVFVLSTMLGLVMRGMPQRLAICTLHHEDRPFWYFWMWVENHALTSVALSWPLYTASSSGSYDALPCFVHAIVLHFDF